MTTSETRDPVTGLTGEELDELSARLERDLAAARAAPVPVKPRTPQEVARDRVNALEHAAYKEPGKEFGLALVAEGFYGPRPYYQWLTVSVRKLEDYKRKHTTVRRAGLHHTTWRLNGSTISSEAVVLLVAAYKEREKK